MGDWADEMVMAWLGSRVMAHDDRARLASELRRAERRGIERALEVVTKRGLSASPLASDIRALLESGEGRKG